MCSSSDVVPPPPTTTNRRLNRRSPSPTSSSSSSSTESRTIGSSGLAVKSPSNSLKSIGGGLDHNISLSSKNSLESISGHRRRVAAATANPSPVQSLESLQQCDDNDNFVSNSPARHSNSSSSSSSSSNSTSTHFKCRKALGTRQGEVQAIRTKYPSKIPVIVERFDQELSLPHLQKSKFLVPQELSMSQLITVVRNRLRLSSTQAIFLIVNNRSMASLSKTVHEVYREYHDPDGFLYLSYASQEAFGSDSVT
ncbi:putative protein TPRXL [Daphnia pulex]|uniref:putative protein TPRXL n=1 Tax=Daphnia pulex TaxID=6669 RepID=UPI001EDE1ED5|nr:putative protein TPRXL [Daphnia pulex]XP_046445891.1 putative protein TPRXL [Daphnia pulex]